MGHLTTSPYIPLGLYNLPGLSNAPSEKLEALEPRAKLLFNTVLRCTRHNSCIVFVALGVKVFEDFLG